MVLFGFSWGDVNRLLFTLDSPSVTDQINSPSKSSWSTTEFTRIVYRASRKGYLGA